MHVSVYAPATAAVWHGVVHAAANVERPASLDGEGGCEHRAAGHCRHGSQHFAAQQEGGEEDKRHKLSHLRGQWVAEP
jgi:hypothetical protein